MIYGVIVYYATRYPPGDHDCSWILVEAGNEVEAGIIACQIASCHSIMPTRSEILRRYEPDGLDTAHPSGSHALPDHASFVPDRSGPCHEEPDPTASRHI